MVNDVVLDIKDLKTHFFYEEGVVKALDGVSLILKQNSTLGVVGESGCGKSVTAQSILRILGPRGRIVEGSITLYRGKDEGGNLDLTRLDPNGDEIRRIRGKDIAMIFQEPMTSFSPLHTVGDQIMEAILLHQNVTKGQAYSQAIEMLERVGMPRAEQRVDEYPHQLSGGMRQRAMIAMALSCHPKILIADEPTTALDVTIQAQILDLMRGLQGKLGMSIMMITHNLGVIAEVAQDVVVMYLGRIVESTSVDSLFHSPAHPYTKALLNSVPRIGIDQRLNSIKGVVPDAYNIPTGCSFHPRCPKFRKGVCDINIPPLLEVASGHWVSCWLYSDE